MRDSVQARMILELEKEESPVDEVAEGDRVEEK